MTESPYENVRYQVDDPVATITLSRPEKLNAWNATMEQELRHALAAAESDPAVVGIVLTGAGRAFCAGADMGLLQTLADGEKTGLASREDASPGDDSFDPGFRQTYSYLSSIRKPIIAAINGPCVGMAVPIACFADLRFASDEAYFMTAFSRRGLIAEWGSSWMLPRLIGPAHAMDMLLSSRKVGAEEAARMGLVNRVVPKDELLAAAQDYVRMLGEHCSPASLAVMKKQVYHDLLKPVDEALNDANERMRKSFESEDFREGVAAFTQKRPARFGRLS